VVQSAEHCCATNNSEVIEAMTRLRNRYHSNCWRIRHARTEGHVWAPAVLMFDPGVERTPQMASDSGMSQSTHSRRIEERPSHAEMICNKSFMMSSKWYGSLGLASNVKCS